MRFKSWYTFLLVTTLATGCRVGPNHCVPEIDAPEKWSSLEDASTPITVSPDHSLVCWWNNFNDPFLSDYMERIFDDNLDLLQSFERISQAISQRQITNARLYPDIDGEVAFTDAKPGLYSVFAAPALSQALNIQQKTTQLQFDARWEVDLFGRTRREIEANIANIEVQVEIKNGILISALSEFARNYLQVRGNQKIASLIEEQIKLLESQGTLTNSRYTVGVDQDTRLQSIKEQLRTLQANLPPIQIVVNSGIYRLSVLIGQNPEYLLDAIRNSLVDLNIPDTIPDVLPSELLRRRPDIRQAERNLAMYTADVGVAVAELFPKINLTAFDGNERISILDFLIKGNVWSFGFDLLTPIFKGGKIIDNIELVKSQRREAMLHYQQTVILAFEDTENALNQFVYNAKVLEDTTAAYNYQKTIYGHSENQYNAGAINQLELFNANQTFLIAEQAVINAQMQKGISLIYLYKALGGGW